MKKILTILLVALIGLTGCKSAESGLNIDNTSNHSNAKIGAKMAKADELENTTEKTESQEVSFDSIDTITEFNDFTYSADKSDIMKLNKVAISNESNTIMLYHEFRVSGKNGLLVPTNMKIVDAKGNEGYNYVCGDTQTGGDVADITQKQFTVWYEFANDPEVGILKVEITLP